MGPDNNILLISLMELVSISLVLSFGIMMVCVLIVIFYSLGWIYHDWNSSSIILNGHGYGVSKKKQKQKKLSLSLC